jgi:hypothetical protein
MAEVTDRDKLSTQTQSTIEWNFGQICDLFGDLVSAGKITSTEADDLQRKVRRHGNNAIRVINAHLAYYNVTQRPEKLPVNIHRVAKKATQGE